MLSGLILDGNYKFLREMITKRRIAFFLIITVILGFLANNGYEIFHSSIEIFTIVIGYCIVLICLNAQKYFDNGFFIFLCIGYAFVGTLDIIQLMAMPGSEIISALGKNKVMQLSVLSKLIECATMIMAFNYANKKINVRKIIAIYTIITAVMLIIVLKFNFIPKLHIAGKGVSDFRLALAYIVFFSYIFLIRMLKNKRKYFSSNTYKHIYIVLILLALSNGVYGSIIGSQTISRIATHYFKLAAYCILYFAVVKVALNDPYDLIFKELSDNAIEMKALNKELRDQNKALINARVEIEKSKKKYEKILSFLPDAILIRNNEKIEYVNSEFLRIFKYNSYDDIVGKNIYEIVGEEETGSVSNRIKASKQNQKLPFIEQRFTALDGEVITVELSSLEMNLDNNRCNLLVIKDIREIKRVENLKNELEEKDNLRTEFFANLSHELRTPINVIHSALQLEDIYIENNDIASIKKYNFIVKQNCYRILRLCNNIIDSNKLETGFIKPRFCYCEIISLIENITSSVISYVTTKKITLTFDTEIEEQYLRCDTDFMERIMLNLLSNSIKFSKEYGQILVTIKNAKNKIYISVKDNGIGISKYRQNAIFERFIQEDKSFTRKCEGSGIGLSLVKSFVELQGGSIDCVSEEGVGTEIIISMPLSEAFDQVAVTEYDSYDDDRIMYNVNVEFADIYFN